MATRDDVRRIVDDLPETVERSSGADDVLQWRVNDKPFLWERPLRRADFEALGDDAPEGPVLAVRVADVGVKEALLTDDPSVFFTTPHFDGYPAVLIRFDAIDPAILEEVVMEAWLLRAPKRAVKAYEDATG